MWRFLILVIFAVSFTSTSGTVVPQYAKQCKYENEVYVLAKYEDATCDGKPAIACKPVKACRCDEGFVRHEGNCIKFCDCPKKCPVNEEFIFTKFLDPRCNSEEPIACKPLKDCRCKKGLVRYQGKCIEKCDCPKKCKCENEVFILAKYEDATCDGGPAKSCKPVKACRCDEGFVRHEGKCIELCDCPKKCPANEELIFTKFLDPTCDEEAPIACKSIKDCRCKKGFVRYQGKCIEKCDCPKKCKCENEVFILAKYEDATCDGGPAKACKPVKACRCDEGFVRHEGKCIELCDCPKKCPANEELIFTKFLDPTCDDEAPIACHPIKDCRCKKGFVRYNGKCIEKCDCPKKCKCENEVFILAKYEDATCDGGPAKACKPVKACRCDEGFVRHEGKCIELCDCPKKCPANEELIFTKFLDPTCDEEAPIACKPIKDCRCKKGFVRYQGKCIEKCDCPKKCPANEELIFTKFLDPTCDDEAPIACHPIKDCRCKKGFVRYNGKCIEKCDCPKKCKCENEVFILAKYEDPTCDGEPAKVCKPVKACRCDEGFVRYEGKCIELCDCPQPEPNDEEYPENEEPIEAVPYDENGEWGDFQNDVY